MPDAHVAPTQFIVSTDDGGELLLTIHPEVEGYAQTVHVAPRVGPSSWGPPLPIRSLGPIFQGGAA